MRRLAADELGLPTAPFWFAGSVAELTAVAEHAGFPMVVKPVIGVPGEGESVLLRPEDVEPAWQRAIAAGGRVTHNRVLAETVVEIDYAVTLLTVRTDGPMARRCPSASRSAIVRSTAACWNRGSRNR
jgi:phosphoribosylglycinamide formyltransferase 2